MRDHDEVPAFQRGEPALTSLDRQGQDGAAGNGDMLGGLSAGAGGRLGPDVATNEVATSSEGYQRRIAEEEGAIDAEPNNDGNISVM